ncbi:RNase H family protein [Agromyces seonyuensis]|uniref:Ribonuclease H n=1 Tax=Agromyces seonyuensis TaxID=2662446 RepID=A0A6I4P441_9MICO|nr:RNase H family protein [Agromyces seonyuensis]MWB99625.1 ribonuclease HI [Agromyces seonyuensis]
MIIAAADGSALGNPGPAGWAWYVDDDNWAAGGWPRATNNQGELQAVIELFRATEHVDDELLVQCDSQYVINTVTKWMPGWKRKGWKKADGKPVMNVELVQELDRIVAGRRYRFEWVRGHVGHPMNEAADVRARGAAEAYRRKAAVPTGPGWTRGGAPKPRAEASAPASARREVPEAPVVAGPDDALFDFDDPIAQWHTLDLELSTTEFERLHARAREAGVSAEEFLRGLI